MNSFCRRWRSSSRHGQQVNTWHVVETPQCQAAGGQQRGGVLRHALRLGLGRNLHLAERIAALGRDADAARDHVGDAGDVGAAAADQDLLRLLATAAGGQEELQRAADLLGHVVDERIEHLGLVVARQAAFLLGAAGLLQGEAVGAHDLLGQLLAAEGEVAGVDDLAGRAAR